MKSLAEFFGEIGVIFLVLILATLISALFVKLGWSLSITPIFGIREITYLEAFGLSLVGGAFRSSGNFNHKKD